MKMNIPAPNFKVSVVHMTRNFGSSAHHGEPVEPYVRRYGESEKTFRIRIENVECEAAERLGFSGAVVTLTYEIARGEWLATSKASA